MSTPFNADQFLQEQTVDGALDTKLPLIPVGEYPAIISKIDARQQPKRDDPSKIFTILDVTYTVEDQSVREVTGLDSPSIRDSLFLDINETTKKLDTGTGKNVALGALRAALGINEGQFNFGMLLGRSCLIGIKHDPDKNDPEKVWARVARVGAL